MDHRRDKLFLGTLRLLRANWQTADVKDIVISKKKQGFETPDD